MDYLIALGNGTNPNRPLKGCEINVRFCFVEYIKAATKNCLSSLDVSEIFISGVSSMCIYIMHYLNFFLSCSIKNLTSASVSRLFTTKSDFNFPFYKS